MRRWWPSRLERQIAVRYLRGQRGTRSAALQTAVTIGGIAVGVMALIVVLGVMNGLIGDLRMRILVGSPHIRVMQFGAVRVDDWTRVADTVAAIPGVAAVAPEVITQTVLRSRENQLEMARVAGLEIGVGTKEVTGLDSVMISGSIVADDPADDEINASVVLGYRLADRLMVRPGDYLEVVAPSSVGTSRITGAPTATWWRVRVTGLFQTGMYIYDNEFVVMDRVSAQRFAGLGESVSSIAVKVVDPWQAAAVAARIDSALDGFTYRTQTWQQQNESLFGALEMEKRAMGLAIFCVILVAAFNIVGTLTMVVAFRTREIGILLAMGLTSGGIARIFLTQGAIVGLVGTVLGLIGGTGVALAVDRWKLIRFDPGVYFIDHLPIRLDPVDVAVVAVAAVLVAVVATIHPARQASRLQPVEAVRAE